jgi:hypothetical protein
MEEDVTTNAQRAANRQNAQKSTGPRTAAGKDVVRFNAVWHGLASRHIVVNAGDGVETTEAYDALVGDLRESLGTQGAMEFILVETIAFAVWAWRRAVRAEAGWLQRRMLELDDRKREQATADEYAVRRDLEALRRGSEDSDQEGQTVKDRTAQSEQRGKFRAIVSRRLRTTESGLTHLLETVTATIDEVVGTHALTEPTIERLEQEFACTDPSLVAQMRHAAHIEPGASPFSPGTEMRVLTILRTEQDRLTNCLSSLVERAATLERTARAEASLPTDEEVKRLQRYKVMYERQLAQALTQLERLQRRQRGDASLPPISISLEASG